MIAHFDEKVPLAFAAALPKISNSRGHVGCTRKGGGRFDVKQEFVKPL